MLNIASYPGVPVGAQPISIVDPILDSNTEGWYPFAIAPDTDPVVIGSNAKTTVNMTLPGDCMLIVEWANLHSTNSQWVNGDMGCAIQITRNGNYSVMNKAMRAELFCGTGQRPGFFSKYPWLVSNEGGQGAMTLDFTDRTNTTHTISFAFGGRRREFRRG